MQDMVLNKLDPNEPGHGKHLTCNGHIELVPPPLPTQPVEDAAAWLRVFSAWLVFVLTWGPSTGFGAFQTYYESDLLRNHSPSSIAWIGSIQSTLMIMAGVLTGPLFDRGFLRILMSVGCMLVALAFMLLSLCDQYYQIMLTQGILFGIGSGLAYIPSLAYVTVSFQKHKLIAVGLTTTGASIGGLIFPIMFRTLQPTIGFPWTTRSIAFIQIGLSVIALLILFRDPMPIKPPRKLFQLEAFSETPFVLFCLAVFLQFLAFWIPLFFIPSYAIIRLKTSVDAGFYLLAATNGASALGRTIPSLIAQRTGVFPVIFFSTLICMVLLFAWIGIKNLNEFIAFCVFWGFFSGVFVSANPVVLTLKPITPTLDVVGTRMGMCWLCMGIGVLIGTPIAGALVDLETASFLRAQVFGGMIMAGAMIAFIWPWISVERAKER